MRISLAIIASIALLSAARAHALSLHDFSVCIGPSGQGPVCQLDAGTYPLSSTLLIGRSNVTVKGTIVTSRRDTVLQRAAGFQGMLLQDLQQASGIYTAANVSITIRDLTIDGNRAQNTLSYSSYSPEVGLSSTGSVLVTNCDFINSPQTSLALNPQGIHNVVISNSYVGNAVLFGIWSGGTGSGDLCGSRHFVDDAVVVNSVFENIGQSAVFVEATNLKFLKNTFTNNHSNSFAFNDDGGQISILNCADNVAIIGNTFQNASIGPNGKVAAGLELHGSNLTVIDNVVRNNSGDGINLDGTVNVFIANWDSSTGSYGNQGAGIAIAHSVGIRATTSTVIDSANSTGNGIFGIWSDTSNTTPGVPVDKLTITNTCLAGNALGPMFLKNLGPNTLIQNNSTSGCGPK